MRSVENLQTYYAIIESRKAEVGRLVTNNFLFPQAIERYIRLKRLYYEEIETGVLFYIDEDTYYHAYYYIAMTGSLAFAICPKEKPILIQHIYKEETDYKKDDFIKAAEKSLINSGFEKKDTQRHAVLQQPEKISKSVAQSITRIQKLFVKEGFTYQKVDEHLLSDVLEFRGSIKEIPYYQFPYFTNEELLAEAEEGRLCCITDRAGKILAARHLIVEGQKAYGWIGVRQEYKKLYGMAVMFLHHALEYIKKNDIKMCSWVDRNNTDSIQYHERIGSVWTGHLMDEWILQ